MIVRSIAIPIVVAVGVLSVLPAEDDTGTQGKTVVVKMVDKSATEFSFEPADVTVRRGDVIRFVQTSTTPHNVEFKDGPEGTEFNGDRVGPYLLTPDETYEISIDNRFATGVHKYVCTPHAFMGMVGTITVEAGR